MTTVLLTGGMGAGKSAVAAMLREQGFPVYDSDSRAKALYLGPLGDEVAQQFACRLPGGGLDMEALAAKVFADAAALSRLEALVHPAVREDFLAWRASAGSEVVFLESAIAASKPGFEDLYSLVFVVTAPLELRLARLKVRDGASGEELLARIQVQPEVEAPDAVIVNDSSLEDLREELSRALDRFGLKV